MMKVKVNAEPNRCRTVYKKYIYSDFYFYKKKLDFISPKGMFSLFSDGN